MVHIASHLITLFDAEGSPHQVRVKQRREYRRLGGTISHRLGAQQFYDGQSRKLDRLGRTEFRTAEGVLLHMGDPPSAV